MNENLKWVGKSRPIHDAWGKAAGYTKYTADYHVSNMAYVYLIQSEIAHGYVKSIDDRKALECEGVYGVFHCFNTSEKKYNRYKSKFFQHELEDEERAFTQYIRFYGERVAAVAASSLDAARKAAKLVKIEYEELPHAVTFDEALEGKHCLNGESPVCDEFEDSLGQFTEDGQDVIVETNTEFPRLHHATMETHACIADYDPYSKNLTVYSPNQAVFGLRTVIAEFLDMPLHKVRVIKATMGGSFGGKQEWFVEPVASLIAKSLCRPVKLVYSRSESITNAYVRAPMKAALCSRFDKDGHLKSLSTDLLVDAGAYIGNSKDYIRTLYGKFFRCYKMPQVNFHVRLVSSNTPVSGAFRGWSAPEEATMVEHNLNAAARRLHMDPIDLRLKNVLLPGDKDLKSGLEMEEIRIKECLLKGRERFDWDQKKKDCREFNEKNERYKRGIGVGCGGHGNTYYPRTNDFAIADLRMNSDGTVQTSISLQDHGCGSVTAVQMILAEALDMEPDRILVTEGDTASTPFDYGCFASRTTFVVGRAAYNAGIKMKNTLIEKAAILYQLPEDDLYAENEYVKRYSNPEEMYSYAQISQDSIIRLREDIHAEMRYYTVTNPGVTGAHFAQVEVDTYTGFTKVLDYLAVHDLGQAINPMMCKAQIQGAVQMGCGAALREKLVIQPNGKCTDSLSKYHLFLANDLPDIQTELIMDGLSEEGPYGAKSIGEASFIPTVPTICAAVNDALDSEIGQIPLDPDCILKYLAGERAK